MRQRKSSGTRESGVVATLWHGVRRLRHDWLMIIGFRMTAAIFITGLIMLKILFYIHKCSKELELQFILIKGNNALQKGH